MEFAKEIAEWAGKKGTEWHPKEDNILTDKLNR
jgi:hypothetical protein